MFQSFMINTWISASAVAVVSGLVGFFVVLRGSAFVAHAIPNGSFAGASFAALTGISSLVGLGVFSVVSALGIGVLSRKGRHDAVTALMLVVLLGLGSLFLSLTSGYGPEVYSLLFGEVLGVSSTELIPLLALTVVTLGTLTLVFRSLMLTTLMPDMAQVGGVKVQRMEIIFLLLVALVTTTAVPIVGTLLVFSLMIGPAIGARAVTSHPLIALGLTVVLSLLVVWISIALSYQTNYPIGFFVGSSSGVIYVIAKLYQHLSATHPRRFGINHG